ncbi:Uncharacterised protein [Mycobacteroides abscessus subsp. abscessus]|nr:Uncharacterised protein [Mycobacteroides abscessus subsp. abscessus]SLD59070.1 Uncharacterised protein [Mycobacteroides abscessus subsp. massiliense]SHY57153.1 Uncharacterised protein [Mycobacteroides abscessus subsp. abscessus]SIN40711.1 Uncharacterised protein [Mycobacteroides abscessus subsp. abscessus]SKT75901.1 Uncharacterised protein [Mycobacteroides abscessus subsp. abscessus]
MAQHIHVVRASRLATDDERVEYHDVGHREEGDDPATNLSPESRLPFSYPEEPVQERSHSR